MVAWGTVKLALRPADPTQPVFAGIGPSADVARYLQGVSRDQVRNVDVSPNRVRYRRIAGEAVPAVPVDQTFWAAQITTDTTKDLTWKVESGDWTVVIMNVDASRGVDTNARLGIKVSWFLPAAIGLLVLGLVLLAGGTVLAILGGRGLALGREEAPPPIPAPGPAPGGAAPAAVGVAGVGVAGPATPAATAEPIYPVTSPGASTHAQPLAVAGQVAPRHPALHRAVLPVDRLRRRHRHRLLRDPLHRPLPARDVRLQRRRPALELAGGLLRHERARHRPLPALHASAAEPTTRPRSTSRIPSASHAAWCS